MYAKLASVIATMSWMPRMIVARFIWRGSLDGHARLIRARELLDAVARVEDGLEPEDRAGDRGERRAGDLGIRAVAGEAEHDEAEEDRGAHDDRRLEARAPAEQAGGEHAHAHGDVAGQRDGDGGDGRDDLERGGGGDGGPE